jgi:hypothetical protein
MVVASLGSIATRIQNRVDDIPTSISGAELIQIVDEQRLFMEEYGGFTIGSVAIAEKYQPALVDLSTAELLANMQLQGGDYNSASLGPLSIKKGEGSNVLTASQSFHKSGMLKLKRLGSVIRFKRVLG